MSYEVLYITILDFIHTQKFIDGPPKDKFMAPPVLVTPDFCNLLSYYEIKLGPRGWIFKKEEKKMVIKYVKKIKINYFLKC